MVNFAGIPLSDEEIVAYLKRSLQIKNVCRDLVQQQIVEQAARERQIAVMPEEIQSAADRMRYELQLESVPRTMNWLTEQLVTPQEWEAGIRDRLLAQKLRERLFAGNVEQSFVESRLDIEKISLYRIRVPYQPLAHELFYQIEEGEISFYEAAHLYDIDEQRRLCCGYDGQFHRWDFEPDIAAELFGASIGVVLGPFAVNHHYDLLMVGGFIPAELNSETQNSILNQLFQEWLESELNHLIHSQTPEINESQNGSQNESQTN